jgi:hypothetical protein
MGQVRCDGISLERHDSGRQETWFLQLIPVIHRCAAPDLQPVHWQHYWRCQPCSYPDRTGGLRSMVKITDIFRPDNGTAPACTPTFTGHRGPRAYDRMTAHQS